MYAAVDSRNVSIVPWLPFVLIAWAPGIENAILTSFRNNSRKERAKSYYNFIVKENVNHEKNTRNEESRGAVLKDSMFSMVHLNQNSSIRQHTYWHEIPFPPLIMHWAILYIWKQTLSQRESFFVILILFIVKTFIVFCKLPDSFL